MNKPTRRRALISISIVVMLLSAAFLGRHAIVRSVLQRGISLATGYDVTFSNQRLGRDHGAFFNVHVTKGGDPVLEAARVDLTYQLRDIFPGGAHRFGFVSLALAGPIFTLVRHADGGYNLTFGGTPAGTPSSTAHAAAPYYFTLRVRDGTIRLVDRAPDARDLAEQEINHVDIDASVKSDARSTAVVHGVLVGKRAQSARAGRYPFSVRSAIDYERGYALTRVRAARLPLRGIAGFLVHSKALRVDDGVLDGIDGKVYAVGIALDRPFTYRFGGGGTLAGGQLSVGALALPVRDLHGRLNLVDDGIWTTDLAGMLAGVALHARGGIYDAAAPTFRLGVSGAGDLHDLRALFAFSRAFDVRGHAQIETLLESKLADPLVHTAFDVPSGSYTTIPFEGIHGIVDYHAGSVTLEGVRANFGGARMALGGRFVLNPSSVDTAIALSAHGAANAIPYAENIAHGANVDALALITGDPRYRARGAIGAHGGGLDGYGFFRVDERGVGEFGPFDFTRTDGSSLVGALRLDRPISASAGWVSAQHFRLAAQPLAPTFPGLRIPAFPPISGVLDGELAGGGTPSSFALAGQISGTEMRVAQLPLGTARARIGGTLADVRIADIHVAGPIGNFDGSGVAANGTFGLRGTYDGTLEALEPLTGKQSAHGRVRGPVLATISSGAIVAQTSGATLDHASVRGVALDAARGTIVLRGGVLHVLAADASIDGARAVAREANGTIAVSAPDLPVRALHGTGLPLQAGSVSIYGAADLRGHAPAFEGTVLIAHGRANGYRVGGDARVDLRGGEAHIARSTGLLGHTYGALTGTIAGIGERALHYDLAADIPLGDIADVQRDLALPVKYLDGSFSAQLRLRGSGLQPALSGAVRVPEGSYNGLAFRDAHALVAVAPGSIAARAGTITVGTTTAALATSLTGKTFALDMRAPHADLADFNDYFDASETLAGTGRVNVNFRADGRRIVTGGDVALANLRYQRYPFGATTARWHTNAGAISAQLGVQGVAGALAVGATIRPQGGAPLLAFEHGRYDGTVNAAGVDLGTWLPAVGIAVPFLGSVDAHGTFDGRFPAIAVSADATLQHGTFDGFTISSAHVNGRAAGSHVTITHADADFGFAQFTASGALGTASTDALALDIHGKTADAGRVLHSLVPNTRGIDVAGLLEADVRVRGSLTHPTLSGGFDLQAARYRAFTIPRAIGAVGLAGNAFVLRDAEIQFTKGEAFVAGSLPLQLAPFGLGPSTAPLSFDVTARAVDLAQFAPLMPARTKLGGTVDGRFGVDGTVARPELLGTASLANGSYVSDIERAPIQHVNAKLTFGGTSVALDTFHADVGGGTLDGSGRIDLPFAQSSAKVGYAVNLQAKGAQLDVPAYGAGKVDGNLQLTSEPTRPLLSGTVALSDAVIPFASIYRSSGTGGDAAGPPALDPAFAIHAVAGRNVRVHSNIIDIGTTGAVDLGGTFTQPTLAGTFTSTGGTFSTYNHAFRVQAATVAFDPADGIVPTIHLRAIAHVTNPDPNPARNIAGSADITVVVDGPADQNNLQITYSSNPAYSEAQIAGLLLDVPAILGAVNFQSGPGGTLLRGAPGESNVLLPPGVSPEQTGTLSVNQEVLSILNGQFTQRALSPIEQVLESSLALSDVGLTIDYGGGIGYSLRRQIGRKDLYASLSQTISYPERSNFGLEFRPDQATLINFSYFRQNGVTSLLTTDVPGYQSFLSQRRFTSVQPLGDRAGFTLTATRRYW